MKYSYPEIPLTHLDSPALTCAFEEYTNYYLDVWQTKGLDNYIFKKHLMMFNIAPGTEFFVGTLWQGNSDWHTLIKKGDKSNISMDLDSPKYPVIIWQCSKCPALGAQWLLWLFEFGWLHANILRKKNSHRSSHPPSLLGVSFLQNELLLPREFWATSLPSWQAFGGLGWAQMPLQEDHRTGGWECQASNGKESVQSGAGTRTERQN